MRLLAAGGVQRCAALDVVSEVVLPHDLSASVMGEAQLEAKFKRPWGTLGKGL